MHGDYEPDASSVDAFLVRQDSIQLTGHRLGFGDQVALRGIFSKVLSRNRKHALLQERLAHHEQLQDLRIHQFVIQDGWIGVAWGVPRWAHFHQHQVER